MRLVYPLLWAQPDRKACRQQTMSTVAALARHGHEITLLMPRGARDPILSAADLKAYFQVAGEFALIQRPSHWAGEALGRTLLWLRQVFRDPVLKGADLLYSRIPAMLGLGGWPPLPFATDHYRPWPDDLPVIRPLVRQTAARRNCLGLILHSRYAARSYERAGIDPAKLLVAHNGVDPPDRTPPEKAEARAALGLHEHRATAAYAGRLNGRKGLDQLLALADLRPDILFLLVGSEGEGPIETVARLRANVRIVPWQTPDALPSWLAAADALLIPASSAPLARHRDCVLPIKLFAYLAAGRPILAPEAADTAELLEHGRNAILVPPDDPAAAAAGLDLILGDPALGARLGEAARSIASELTWDARAARISHFFAERLQRPA